MARRKKTETGIRAIQGIAEKYGMVYTISITQEAINASWPGDNFVHTIPGLKHVHIEIDC